MYIDCTDTVPRGFIIKLANSEYEKDKWVIPMSSAAHSAIVCMYFGDARRFFCIAQGPNSAMQQESYNIEGHLMLAYFPISILSCSVKTQSLNSSQIRAHKVHWHHGAVTSPFLSRFFFRSCNTAVCTEGRQC